MRLLFATLALAATLTTPALAQSEVTKAQIDELNETNKAILRELREIRRVLLQQQAGVPPQAPPTDAVPAEPVTIANEPFKGAASAKVAIVEFSDFQCPFCARFARDTYPEIVKNYVESGKVRYVWRDLPLESIHPNALKAAEAAHCAGEQSRFWEMHDVLFANHRNLGADELPKHAGTVKLNAAAFRDCLASGRHEAAVRKDIEEAMKLGINGTPAFLLGIIQPDGRVKVSTKLYGARPFADFQSAIEELLAVAAGRTE